MLVGRVQGQFVRGYLHWVLFEVLRCVVSQERFVGHAQRVPRNLVPVVDRADALTESRVSLSVISALAQVTVARCVQLLLFQDQLN